MPGKSSLLGVLALLLGWCGGPATADVAGKMRGMFNSLGAHASVDRPRYVAAQSRHVFTAGGLTYRVPRDNFQLVSATPPSLEAGCGGIDLYAGSFSFINKDRFVQMLKNIAANSVGLAFKTALCSTSANLCQAIEDLQKTVQSLNRFNIDSCEAAQRIVGGFMGGMQQSSQRACQASSRSAGLASDASEAREMCATQADYARTRDQAASADSAKTQPVEFVGGNLTWTILGEVAGSFDQEEREFLMSMLGTHVVATLSLSLQHFPPTVTTIADLNTRVVTLLKCVDAAACLRVVPTQVTLATSFLDLATDRLNDMHVRLSNGDELTDAQLNLIAGAPVPILSLVQADVAGAAGLLAIAAEAVAYASAHHYLTIVLRRATATVSTWRSRSVSEAELTRAMVAGTRDLRTALTTELHTALNRVSDLLEVNDRVRDLRRGLANDLLGQVGN